MQVFLICENVDLGYHVEAAYADEAIAKSICDEMNATFNTLKIKNLMLGCNYTQQQAEEYVSRTTQFFVETHEIL